MPTYGYECLSCQDQFETFQSIKDAPLTTCEACGGTLRKRVYPVGIAFKGSGFYVNDYAPKSGGPSEAAPKSDAKTDTAPAATETKPEAAKPEAPKPDAPKTGAKSEKAAPAAA